MTITDEHEKTEIIREAIFAVVYYIFYLGYLLINPETEWLHWITLVGLPLLFLFLYYRKKRKHSFRFTLASCGLQKHNLSSGVWWATILGLLLSFMQLFMANRDDEFLELICSGKVLILLPLAFLLLIFTAGFTEEFFFRGVLLTRLTNWIGSKFWSIVISAVLFGLYHLPYAYLNPNWPSYGDFSGALMTSIGEGIPAGLLLGFVYVKSKNNLIASILVHTLIDLLPAMTMLKFFGL